MARIVNFPNEGSLEIQHKDLEMLMLMLPATALKVYLCLWVYWQAKEVMPRSSGDIAWRLDLPRSSVSNAIKQLKTYNLLETEAVGNRSSIFTVYGPENITAFCHAQRAAIGST